MSVAQGPTARWNRETREVEYYEEEPPSRPPRYSLGQPTVKGLEIHVTIPWPFVERAEQKGLAHEQIARAAQAGAIIGARNLSRDDPGDATANGPIAEHARIDLGIAIQERRAELRLTRTDFYYAVHKALVEQHPELNPYRGWSKASVTAWERGRSAPRSVEPLIVALRVEDEEADRWRELWQRARRGVVPERADEAPPRTRIEQLRDRLMAGEPDPEPADGQVLTGAAARLRETLDEQLEQTEPEA